MITGFNTDIDHDGRVYHVQTEDRGLKHPVVESLVYCGGEIIASRRNPYGDLVESGDYCEERVQAKMEEQHKRLMREIRNGKFDAEEMMPFGHNIVSNRSLDEVVLTFIDESIPLEQLQLKLTGPKVLRTGARPTLKLEVIEQMSERPVCHAAVSILFVTTGRQTRELFAAETDERGRVVARFDIPSIDEGNAALLCRAEAGGKTAEIKRMVRKGASEVVQHSS